MSKFSMADLLNSQSKPQKSKDPEVQASDGGIRNIPIEKIIPSDKNKYGIRDIEDLAATIETVGLLHNLVVKEGTEPGTYELVSGERRLEALKLLVKQGKTEFALAPCKVENQSDPAISELQLLFANSTARNLTDYEKMYQAKRIKELLLQLKDNGYKFKGRMRDIVAGLLKISPAQMGHMESINKNLSSEFQEEFKAGKINMTAAYELSRLPEQQQKAEMQEYRDSGTVEIKEVQERRKEKKKPDTAQPVRTKRENKEPEQREPPEQEHNGPAQRQTPERDLPEPAQRPEPERKQSEPEKIITQLRAIADGADLDVRGICRKAADLIMQLEGRLKE